MSEIQTAVIESARFLSPHVRELTLHAPPFVFAPGQWLSLRLPIGNKPPLVRAYSLARPASPLGKLTLCFDRVENGLGSEYLWNVEPETTIEFTGPLGNFVLPEDDHDLLFLAHYTGVVPFYAMIQALKDDDSFYASRRRVHLLVEAATESELVYHRELVAIALQTPWLDYRPCVDGDAAPLSGIGSSMTVLDGLQANFGRWQPFIPYVCGVRDFTLPARNFLMERGFERRQVKVENYNGPAGR